MTDNDREDSVPPVTRSHCTGECENAGLVGSYRGHSHEYPSIIKQQSEPATSTPIIRSFESLPLTKVPLSSIKTKESRDALRSKNVVTEEKNFVAEPESFDSESSYNMKKIIKYWSDSKGQNNSFENSRMLARDLTPDSLRRIQNESIAFEQNLRTNYTYAATPSYKSNGKYDYDSPILARKPIGYHNRFQVPSPLAVKKTLGIFAYPFSWLYNALFISTEWQDEHPEKRVSFGEDQAPNTATRSVRHMQNLTLDETSFAPTNDGTVFYHIRSILYWFFVSLPFYFAYSFLFILQTIISPVYRLATGVSNKVSSFTGKILEPALSLFTKEHNLHHYDQHTLRSRATTSVRGEEEGVFNKIKSSTWNIVRSIGHVLHTIFVKPVVYSGNFISNRFAGKSLRPQRRGRWAQSEMNRRKSSWCVSPWCCILCWLPLLLLLAMLLYARERSAELPVFLNTFTENSKASLYATAVYLGGAAGNAATTIHNYTPDFAAWYAALPVVIPVLPRHAAEQRFYPADAIRNELIALQMRVDTLEKGLAVANSKRWAEIGHMHSEYVTRDELNERLASEKAKFNEMRALIAALQSVVDGQTLNFDTITQNFDEYKQQSKIDLQKAHSTTGHDSMLKELSQIIAAMGQRIAILENEALVMSKALHSQGDELKDTAARLNAAILIFEKSDANLKAEIDMQGSKTDGTSRLPSDSTLAQLAMLPSLLAKLDKIDIELKDKINAHISAQRDSIIGAASDAAIVAVHTSIGLNGEKAVSHRQVDLLIGQLREQQEAFADLRQRVLALAASLSNAAADHEKTQEKYISQMSSMELQLSDLGSECCGKGHHVNADLQEIQRLIAAALAVYDADKTGLVDYALESAGGQIISTRCTVTYAQKTRRESIWGIPLFWSNYSPRTVIQRKSQSVIPGECWAFEGTSGALLIGLSGVVKVTHVTYEHIPLQLAPENNLDSAPKLMQIWGSTAEHDPNSTQIGEFEFDAHKVKTMQTFALDTVKYPAALKSYPMIELKVLSNHGHPQYTCLYRLRVHGDRVYPQYGREGYP